MRIAVLLSGLAGWLALSYEILWYRMVSFASRGMASGFGFLLGAYLFGLAAGAVACRARSGARAPAYASLARFILVANAASFCIVPAVSHLVTVQGMTWFNLLPLVGVAAAGMGAVFPLLAEAAVKADERAGQGVSWLYVANVVGSVAGTLVTGFVLMDALSIASVSRLLVVAGAGMAAATAWLAARRGRALLPALLTAAAALLASPVLFDGVYERLQRKGSYSPGFRFAHVVETKSGVVTVDAEGTVYGGGIYDGAFNIDPSHAGNDIVRAFAVVGLHPRPREVLQIGLASGSWAAVLGDLPGVERVTVVEINPGYLQLLPKYEDVAGLIGHPRVKIEIDDGRRWLVRNAERKFDVIIANVWNWRGGSTNLLSREFLELVRRRLNPGGVFYYNTTGSPRVLRTGLEAFPYALRVRSYLAVSDAPLEFREADFRAAVEGASRKGRRLFDLRQAADVRRLDDCLRSVTAMLVSRERLLQSTAGERIITDDNMGTEWSLDMLE